MLAQAGVAQGPGDGVAPFPKRDESDYDTFGVGHSSTSISAALGMAIAAAASGVPAADVADFVNANLATGYAEHVPEPEPEPGAPAKPTGLFGRFRGR